jgi:16S rRNA (cytidine1402-2'-O)-methyltransferase
MAAPALIVLATPIGNLSDLSPRAADALRAADVIACEDTRRTRILAQHVGSGAELVALHRHNEAARARALIDRMERGEQVVLVSDAGAPTVSDPGALLIARAHRSGVTVSPLPGPSAVTAALMAAGLPAERFSFVGFFPRAGAERERLLHLHDALEATVVGFESPKRVAELLSWLDARDPDREVVVCRELTKLHEQVVRGTPARVAGALDDAVRGEITVVLAPAARQPAEVDLVPALGLLADAGVGARTAAEVMAALGVASRNAAYRAALEVFEGD